MDSSEYFKFNPWAGIDAGSFHDQLAMLNNVNSLKNAGYNVLSKEEDIGRTIVPFSNQAYEKDLMRYLIHQNQFSGGVAPPQLEPRSGGFDYDLADRYPGLSAKELEQQRIHDQINNELDRKYGK